MAIGTTAESPQCGSKNCTWYSTRQLLLFQNYTGFQSLPGSSTNSAYW